MGLSVYPDFDLKELNGLNIIKVFIDSKGNYIVFTKHNGVYAISKHNGKLKSVYPINSKGNLNINQVIKGKNGEYWIASTNGIFNINLVPSVNYVETSDNVNCILTNRKSLFVGTDKGLYKVQEDSLLKIKGITEKVTGITQTNNRNYITTQNIIFEVNNLQSEEIINWSANFHDILYLEPPFNKLITSLQQGLFFITEQNGILTKEKPLITTRPSGTIVQISDEVWVHILPNSILRLKQAGSPVNIKKKYYDLQEQNNVQVITDIVKLGNSFVAITANGLLKYNEQTDNFTPYNLFEPLYADESIRFNFLKEVGRDTLFFSITARSRTKCGLAYIGGGSIKSISSLKIINANNINDVCYNCKTNELIVGADKLYRYNLADSASDQTIPKSNIRSIVLNSDSILFQGANNKVYLKNIFRHKYNSLAFNFALPFYIDEQKNQYSYILDGHDVEWSDYYAKNIAVYKKLKSGAYTFRVKALNSYGIESEESVVSFVIKALWYRSIVAYCVYFLCFALTLGTIVYYIIKRNYKLPVETKEIIVNIAESQLVSAEDKLLEKAVAAITKNLQNENLSVDFLSNELGISRQHLHQKLKSICDCSPSELINMVKLEKALQMLKHNSGNIGEIAFLSGFESTSYFSKKFKERFGKSPSIYALEKERVN